MVAFVAVLLLGRISHREREDWETGKPTKDKLVELGLDDAAGDLWPS